GISLRESQTTFRQTCWEVDFAAHHHCERWGKPHGNPLINWFRELGILGQVCDTKRVPEWVFEAGTPGACEFLAGYLATDGCVKVRPHRCHVHFDTTSHDLARDVQLLLLKIGVVSTIQEPQRKDGKYRPIYRVMVNPMHANVARLARVVQPLGRKGLL